MRRIRIARPKRRGAVVVQVAVSMLTLMGFAAVAVDLGYIRVGWAEMQRAADSSALAGASGRDCYTLGYNCPRWIYYSI